MTKTTLSFLTLITMAAGTAHAAKEVPWNLDPLHTTIGFSVRHLAITKVRGELKEFGAKIWADAKTAKVTRVEATAKTASIDTGLEKRDQHLRSEDFFAADKYPTLKIVTKDVRWKGNKVTAKADLTIRNITKTVTFKGELLGVQKVDFGDGPQLRAGFSLETTINRHDFGLKFSKLAEGVAVVGDRVTIQIDAEISRSL